MWKSVYITIDPHAHSTVKCNPNIKLNLLEAGRGENTPTKQNLST